MSEKTVLLVDCDRRSTACMQQALGQAGFRVEIAADGPAGLRAFHRTHPALTIVEALIPCKPGFEICREIKDLPAKQRCPVIITSASYRGRNARAEAMRRCDCDEYLEKPITGERLLEVCRRLLDGREGAQGAPGVPEPEMPAEERAAPPNLDEMNEEELIAQLDALLPEDGPSEAVAAGLEGGQRPRLQSVDDALATITELLLEDDDERTVETAGEQEIDSQLDRVLSPGPAGGRPATERTSQVDEAATRRPLPAHPSPSDGNAAGKPAAAARPATPQREHAAGPAAVSESVAVPQPARSSAPAATPHPMRSADAVAEPMPAPDSPAPAPASRPVAQTECVAAAPGPGPGLDPAAETTRDRRWILPGTLTAAGLIAGAVWLFGGFGSSPSTGDVPRASVQRPTPTQVAPPRAYAALPSAGTMRTPGVSTAATEPPVRTASDVQSPASGGDDRGTAPAEPRPTLAADAAGEERPQVRPSQPAPDRASSAPPPTPAKEERVATPPPNRQPHATDGTTTGEPTAEPLAGTDRSLEAHSTPSAPVAIPDEVSGPRQPPTQDAERNTPADAPSAFEPASPPPARGEAPGDDAPVAVLAAPRLAPPWSRAEPAAAGSVRAPAPPATHRGALVPLEEVDTVPVAVLQPAPDYPVVARSMHRHGTVELDLLIDEKGRVIDARHRGGDAGRLLVEAALAGCRRWTYEPAKKDGVPVRVWKPVQVEFKR